MPRDVSVIIPARNEVFLQRTVQDVLENIRADSEVIAICDASWPDPPLQDHPRLNVVHTTTPVGQRGGVNLGARVSQAKYVMKLDAHCAVDEGFDVKLMEDCQPDWTLIPSLYKLHIFDWECGHCGDRSYQGSKPKECRKCGRHGTDQFKMIWLWKRRQRPTFSWRFDRNLQFQYWSKHHKRREWRKKDIIETMSCNGPCFFMERERFWELDGLDEAHGSWGQFGTELACKAWLSGGKMMTTRRTWFAHLFRTGNFSRNGESAFPYPLSGNDQQRAKDYSQKLWLNNAWPKQIHKLEWLVERFRPVPDWHDE